MAQGVGWIRGCDRSCRRDHSPDSAMAVTPIAVSAGYRNRPGEARHGNRHALDLAHARFELRVFCRAAPAGSSGSNHAADCTSCLVLASPSPKALRCNLDVGPGDGCVPGGGPYRFGTFWTLPVVQRSGREDLRAATTRRSRHDLRRPGVWFIPVVLSATPDRVGRRTNHFHVVWIHLPRRTAHLYF